MKIRFWDKLLIAIAGLVLLFVGICLVLCGTGLFHMNQEYISLNTDVVLWKRCVIVGVGVLLAMLGIHGLLIPFRKKNAGFVLQETEYGAMSISIKALEAMARKCVESQEDMTLQSIEVEKGEKDISVEMKVLIPGGVNIPQSVAGLQKQIRNYIWNCAGVEVKTVSVMVETDKNRLAAPLALTPPEEAYDDVMPVENCEDNQAVPAVAENTAEKQETALQDETDSEEADMPEEGQDSLPVDETLSDDPAEETNEIPFMETEGEQ